MDQDGVELCKIVGWGVMEFYGFVSVFKVIGGLLSVLIQNFVTTRCCYENKTTIWCCYEYLHGIGCYVV
jgi:hypothetical protein